MIEKAANVVDLTISVCVIQFTGRDHLVRCLDALRDQRVPPDEVIVPHDDSLTEVSSLASRFPRVRFLRVGARCTPAQLRSAATLATVGDVIAFLEDHCVPASDWVVVMRRAHDEPHAAVGGSVDKGFLPGRSGDTGLNWAVYLTDYSRYMNPQVRGPVASVTDCNVSYKRSALESIRAQWQTELHENVINESLAQAGHTLWLEPGMVVHEQRSLTWTKALRDRFTFGRLFASTRVRGAGHGRRLLFAAGSLLLPPVLVGRVARNALGRRRYVRSLAAAFVPLLIVTSTWMIGEFVGYTTGRPNRSLRPR